MTGNDTSYFVVPEAASSPEYRLLNCLILSDVTEAFNGSMALLWVVQFLQN